MALQFTTTDQAAALHGVKVLVHSRAGMGKTTLCATAPSPLVISVESGLLALRSYRLPVIVVHTMAELEEAHRFVATSEHARQFQTVCIDSLSEVAEVVLAAEKLSNKDPRKAYGEMQDQMTRLIRQFRDLPGKHVYFSAKQSANKDEATGITLYGPSMPGRQLGPQLPYFFDEVFCLDVGRTPEGQDYRFLRTRADMQYEAKDRSGALDAFEPPNLTHIFNKIMGVTQHG